MIGFLVGFSALSLLVSAWMLARAAADARKYFPLQLTDELSSRYFMQNVMFNRSIPPEIRRRVGISSALALVPLVGFAAVAWLGGNPVLAVLLLLVCGFAVVNIVGQWRNT